MSCSDLCVQGGREGEEGGRGGGGGGTQAIMAEKLLLRSNSKNDVLVSPSVAPFPLLLC